MFGQFIFLAASAEVCFVQNRRKTIEWTDIQMVIRMAELRQTDRRVGAGRLLNIQSQSSIETNR